MTTRPAAVELSEVSARTFAASRRQVWRLAVLSLTALDALALACTFGVAYLIRFKAGLPWLPTPDHDIAFYSSIAFWAIPAWLCLLALYRLYDRRHLFVGLQEYIRLINACTAGMLVVIVVSFLDTGLFISRGWLLIVWALSLGFLGASRFAARRVLRGLRRGGRLVSPALIVGANEEGQALAEQFVADPTSGMRVVGLVDATVLPGTRLEGGLTVVGDLGDLDRLVRERGVEELVVATTALTRQDLLDLYRRFGHVEGLEIRLSSGLFEILTTGVTVQELSCVSLMTPQRVRITGVDAVLKTGLDYVIAALGLVVLSPLLVFVALLVRRDSPGPALYRRRVLGQGGRQFDAFKLRTMVVDAEAKLAADSELSRAFAEDYKLKVDPRVTRLGRILRQSSIDELPQLLNVLRGEMSLVGPRMIVPDEAARYGKWQLNLLTVKPGITGPWQVFGRSDIPYEERVRLNMHYIRNYSVWLDLAILIRTVFVVFKRDGAY